MKIENTFFKLREILLSRVKYFRIFLLRREILPSRLKYFCIYSYYGGTLTKLSSNDRDLQLWSNDRELHQTRESPIYKVLLQENMLHTFCKFKSVGIVSKRTSYNWQSRPPATQAEPNSAEEVVEGKRRRFPITATTSNRRLHNPQKEKVASKLLGKGN